VHFSADSSGILKLEKAESVIEVWENYEVEVPVETLKENITIEATRETLEDDAEADTEVHTGHCVLPVWSLARFELFSTAGGVKYTPLLVCWLHALSSQRTRVQ